MTDPTADPTPALAGMIEAALRAAGIETEYAVWETEFFLHHWHVSLRHNAGRFRLYPAGPLSGIEYREVIRDGSRAEEAVSLVRAVLASGWRAEVAAYGIVPDTDSMLEACAARGWAWSSTSDPEPTATLWKRGADPDGPLGDYYGRGAYADTLAEALAKALLMAFAAEAGS